MTTECEICVSRPMNAVRSLNHWLAECKINHRCLARSRLRARFKSEEEAGKVVSGHVTSRRLTIAGRPQVRWLSMQLLQGDSLCSVECRRCAANVRRVSANTESRTVLGMHTRAVFLSHTGSVPKALWRLLSARKSAMWFVLIWVQLQSTLLFNRVLFGIVMRAVRNRPYVRSFSVRESGKQTACIVSRKSSEKHSATIPSNESTLGKSVKEGGEDRLTADLR